MAFDLSGMVNHPFLGAARGMALPQGVMPAAPPNMPPAYQNLFGGAPPAQLPPQQVGMVPGVPGSVGLNPGATDAGGGPVMTPPHVIAGQPAPAAGGAPFDANSFFATLPPGLQGVVQNFAANSGPNGPDRHGWRDAMQAWQAQRPGHVADDGGNPGLAAWRASRPTRTAY